VILVQHNPVPVLQSQRVNVLLQQPIQKQPPIQTRYLTITYSLLQDNKAKIIVQGEKSEIMYNSMIDLTSCDISINDEKNNTSCAVKEHDKQYHVHYKDKVIATSTVTRNEDVIDIKLMKLEGNYIFVMNGKLSKSLKVHVGTAQVATIEHHSNNTYQLRLDVIPNDLYLVMIMAVILASETLRYSQ
jgi:hypothetical protein